MSAKREADFLQKDILKGYYRVGFRCSFPGCNRLLVGPKNDQKGYFLSGEACHITAAQAGGPRFDETLSITERKSFENLIIMCRNHGLIIDQNQEKYPVELLKKWKKDAEDKAANEQSFGINESVTFHELEATFDYYFSNCEFKLLDEKIETIGFFISREKEEVILRYKIKTYIINGKNYKDELIKYCDNEYDNIDDILSCLIVHRQFDELELIRKHYTSYDEAINIVLNNDVITILRSSKLQQVLNSISDNLTLKMTMHELLFHETFSCVHNEDGEEIELIIDELYFKIINDVINLKKKVIIEKNEIYSEEAKSSYVDILTNISIIDKFNTKLKIRIYEIILVYLLVIDNNKDFDKIYDRLSEEEKNFDPIMKLYLQKTLNITSDFDVYELIEHCKRLKTYQLLINFLSRKSQKYIYDFLSDHKYLLKEDSRFLLIFSECISSDYITLLKDYEDIYAKDFTYNCLCWKYKYNYETSKNFCLVHASELNVMNLELFLDVLIDDEEYDYYFGLFDKILEYDILAKYLMKLHSLLQGDRYDLILEQKYSFLLKNGVEMKGLRHNLAYLLKKKGMIEDSKKYLHDEIKIYNSYNSLNFLINLRLEKREYLTDYIFEKCKLTNDPHLLYYVAECYYINRDLYNAKNYYIHSLVMIELI